jgi:hypothetical protein
MLIEEQYRKCTTFLYVDKVDAVTGETKRIPCGTAFFVSYKFDDNLYACYSITARHVISRSYSYHFLYLRINTKDGGYIDLEIPHRDWVQHHATDIAATQIEIPENADIKAVPTTQFATDDFINKKGVGIGDEVFFIGLFTPHPGQLRSLPIVRFGHISLLPYEPIQIQHEPDSSPISIEAYLCEARSWGGQSGSPTFIHFPAYRQPGVIDLPQYPLKEPLFTLFGLVSGHYDIATSVDFRGDVLGDGRVSQNTGIAVVIPAKYILELLNWEEFEEQRLLLKNNNE